MISLYSHKTDKTCFHIVADGLIDINDAIKINQFFEPLINSFTENSLTLLTEVKPQTQLINFSFIKAIKPMVPIYKPFIKQRIVFGLTGINHIVFRNYAKLVGFSGERHILKDRLECETLMNINFEQDFY